MTNAWLNFAIGISGGLVTFIAFGGEIAEVSRFKFIGKLWVKLVITAISLAVGIWASIQKDNLSEDSSRIEKLLAFKEQSHRDSLSKIDLRNSLDTNSIHLVTTFTNALSKYGLKYDSVQSIIVRLIKDSSKKVINVVNGNDPYFNLCPDNDSSIVLKEVNGNKYVFKTDFCNEISSSRHINVDVYLVAIVKNGINKDYKYGGKLTLFNDARLSVNQAQEMSFDYTFPIKLEGVYFLFKGNYTNSDSSKNFEVNDLYYYSFYTKKNGTVNEPFNTDVRNFLRSINIMQ